MVNGVNGVTTTQQTQAGTGASGSTPGTFAALLAQELSTNDAYMNALTSGAGSNTADVTGTGYAPVRYTGGAEAASTMQAAEAAALQAVYGAGYAPVLQPGAHPVTGLNAEEQAALQAAREALLLPPVDEEAEQGGEQAAAGEESALSSLFGGNVNLGEMLMLMCMMLASGGMGGSEGGLSGGMGAMIGSLGKALAQKNTQEQELLRYDMLTNGYKTSNPSESLDEAATYVNEALFSETSEASYPYRAGKPCTPAITSTEADRDPALYRQVIDQFAVTSNPRYLPNKKGDGDTYCNIYLWDVTSAMGAEIPHYTDWDTGEPLTYPDVDGAKFMNANRIYDWLADTGARYGWVEVSAEEAQLAANAGEPAITIWKNPSGGHGHCQIVCPSLDSAYNPERGVTIAQAGNTLRDYAYIDQVYSNSLPDVKYYAHA